VDAEHLDHGIHEGCLQQTWEGRSGNLADRNQAADYQQPTVDVRATCIEEATVAQTTAMHYEQKKATTSKHHP
jgi:hypothetical protein